MHVLRFLGGSSVLAAAALSGAPGDPRPEFLPASTPPMAVGRTPDSVLPLRIPGYELRVLEFRKPVVLKVGGEQVEASLPIFFYSPTPDRAHAAKIVRQAYDDLQTLGRKTEWTTEEFQSVIAQLEAALRQLEADPQATGPKN